MSAADTSGSTPFGDGHELEPAPSNPDKFSFSKIARLISEFNANAQSLSDVDVDSLHKADATLDDAMREKATQFLDQKVSEAETLVSDPAAVASVLDSLKNWTERFSKKLKPSSFEGLTTIFRMLSSAFSGEYSGFSKSTLAYLVGAAMYCVSPIDVIPDAIPVAGLVDDAFVLAWTLKRVTEELTTFRQWERLKTAKSILASYLPYFNGIERVVLVTGWLSEEYDCSAVIETLKPVFPKAEFEEFGWKSNVAWNEARDYVDGPGPAELCAFLREKGDLANVALVGHSLGGRLVARALALLAKEPQKKTFWARKPANRVAQAFLLGAAIDSDDPDLTLAVSGANAPLCNFFNRSDRVLNYLYRAAEQKSPLGLGGIATPCENYVDCVVSGREEYWLGFVDNIASVLSFVQSKTFLAKFSLAESTASGLTSYWGHDFQAYASFFRNSVLIKKDARSVSEVADA